MLKHVQHIGHNTKSVAIANKYSFCFIPHLLDIFFFVCDIRPIESAKQILKGYWDICSLFLS